MMKKFLNVLNGNASDIPPIWFMRQAGRYLSEYRELRAEAGDFLTLCYTPDFACEVTLQPIRRFGFDAAILFSDILVIPHALGQDVSFVPGRGPVLGDLNLNVLSLDKLHEHLSPVYSAVGQIRSQLKNEGFENTALIGFAGAPLTVASYMVEGGSTKDFMQLKKFIYGQPEQFNHLLDLLVEGTAQYLIRQVEAGAEALQIFESWSGIVSYQDFERFVIQPNKRIVDIVRKTYPDIPIIGFPKAAAFSLKSYAEQTGMTALGLDYTVPLDFARDELQTKMPVQGNLDPGILYAGGAVMEDHIRSILDHLKDGPFIFNLGHGIHKNTPIEHVQCAIQIIREEA